MVVAVPAVRATMAGSAAQGDHEDLAAFTNDLHGYLMSNGQVKPRMAGVATQTKTGGATPQRDSEPLRAGDTRTGAQGTPTTADRV